MRLYTLVILIAFFFLPSLSSGIESPNSYYPIPVEKVNQKASLEEEDKEELIKKKTRNSLRIAGFSIIALIISIVGAGVDAILLPFSFAFAILSGIAFTKGIVNFFRARKAIKKLKQKGENEEIKAKIKRLKKYSINSLLAIVPFFLIISLAISIAIYPPF